MTKSCCVCDECRATIRATILETFDQQLRWMGPYTIIFEDRSGLLRRIPEGLYFELLIGMCSEGRIVYSYGPDDPFPRLLPVKLMGRPAPILGREVAP